MWYTVSLLWCSLSSLSYVEGTYGILGVFLNTFVSIGAARIVFRCWIGIPLVIYDMHDSIALSSFPRFQMLQGCMIHVIHGSWISLPCPSGLGNVLLGRLRFRPPLSFIFHKLHGCLQEKQTKRLAILRIIGLVIMLIVDALMRRRLTPLPV